MSREGGHPGPVRGEDWTGDDEGIIITEIWMSGERAEIDQCLGHAKKRDQQRNTRKIVDKKKS